MDPFNLFVCFQIVTISCVLPCVLSLHAHLTRMQLKYLNVMREAMVTSLCKRFEGLFKILDDVTPRFVVSVTFCLTDCVSLPIFKSLVLR